MLLFSVGGDGDGDGDGGDDDGDGDGDDDDVETARKVFIPWPTFVSYLSTQYTHNPLHWSVTSLSR